MQLQFLWGQEIFKKIPILSLGKWLLVSTTIGLSIVTGCIFRSFLSLNSFAKEILMLIEKMNRIERSNEISISNQPLLSTFFKGLETLDSKTLFILSHFFILPLLLNYGCYDSKFFKSKDLLKGKKASKNFSKFVDLHKNEIPFVKLIPKEFYYATHLHIDNLASEKLLNEKYRESFKRDLFVV